MRSTRAALPVVLTALLATVAASTVGWTAATGASPTTASGSQIGGTLPAGVISSSAATGTGWTPEAATYGVGKTADVPVTMADGTVLRADIYYPTDASGHQAAGSFPVLLTQTPYGKGALGALGGSIGSETGPDDFLVKRGYLDVVADVRGTGDSEGSFGLFDPIQDTDGVTLVNWAAHLPGSDGKVGLYGASYLGIDQLLTAGAEAPGSPLKAIFPVVPANDIYKDTATMGGLIDLEFDAFYLALTAGLNVAGPLLDAIENPTHAAADLSPAELQHLEDLGTFDATFTAQTLLGAASAYDGAYWQARNPSNVLSNIVADGIPAYIVGGEYDLFQRGEPLDFAGLQNAWDGRPTTSAMRPDQPVTGRYQLIDGPFTHLGASTVNFDPLELEWFDTWLKGEDTGMATTPTPLHYYDLGTGQYTEHSTYPFSNATPTRFYFGGTPSLLGLGSGKLTTTPPTGSGSDTVLWSPVGNPCGRPSDQWSAGAISLVTSYVSPNTPCINNDALGQLGLDRASYTTAPMTSAETIAGPIDVTLYAKATTPETELVAEVEDVAPNGTSTPLTEGALLGSLRAMDPATTWTAPDGQVLQAGHTYSQSSAAPVVPGAVTRYDIEVFPTYATIAPGHRIRVTISTADSPHLVPTAPELLKLLGGVYTIERSPSAPSAIEIPLID